MSKKQERCHIQAKHLLCVSKRKQQVSLFEVSYQNYCPANVIHILVSSNESYKLVYMKSQEQRSVVPDELQEIIDSLGQVKELLFELGLSRRETRDIVYRAMRIAMGVDSDTTDLELLELVNERQHQELYRKKMKKEISQLIFSIQDNEISESDMEEEDRDNYYPLPEIAPPSNPDQSQDYQEKSNSEVSISASDRMFVHPAPPDIIDLEAPISVVIEQLGDEEEEHRSNGEEGRKDKSEQ